MTVEEARKQAEQLLKDNPGEYPEMRSCWKCNQAHEHLKEHDLICCFICSHYYYKGIDITKESK